jgi:hypothetical protein
MAKSNVISIDKLYDVIDITLEDYARGVDDVLSDASIKAAKVAESELHQTSPKRTGEYRKSWTYDFKDIWKGKRNGYRTEMVVFNKDHYRLTHLLEKSHRIANGSGVYGKSKAQPHIAPAQKTAESKFMSVLQFGLESIRV